MKGLEPVMFSAIAGKIPWHGKTAGSGIRVVEGDGVVNVADGGGPVASREPAGNVAAADPAFQRCRGVVTQGFCWAERRASRLCGGLVPRGLCGRGRRALEEPQRCGLGEPAYMLGVDHAIALEVAGLIALARYRVLTRDHVDHRSRRARSRLGVG